MNPSSPKDPQAIRSDINLTRRRMDDTMDALGDRLQPQHLLDEILGFFRASDGNSRLTQMREKIAHSANTAVHAVTDTVKKNPVPALLIGAGVAWMIYESRRHRSELTYTDEDYAFDRPDEKLRYDPDQHYDRPLEYPGATPSEAGMSKQGGSKVGAIKDQLADKASGAAEQLKDKVSHASDLAREKMENVRERAGEVTAKVKDRTHEAYTRTRQRVVTTADEHPLEVGLVALAAGLIAGLAIPTPSAVNRAVGPTADRLRARTREAGAEMLEKSKHVAQAAAEAAKEEAEAQGLTPEHLREKTTAVAERATEAGKETAQREGMTSSGEGNPTAPSSNDPTGARPVT